MQDRLYFRWRISAATVQGYTKTLNQLFGKLVQVYERFEFLPNQNIIPHGFYPINFRQMQ